MWLWSQLGIEDVINLQVIQGTVQYIGADVPSYVDIFLLGVMAEDLLFVSVAASDGSVGRTQHSQDSQCNNRM